MSIVRQGGNPGKQIQQTKVEFMQHVGPIPDPATLERYNQVQPGFAERIMVMAEKEQKQRHENDIAILSNQHEQHKRDTDTYRLGHFCHKPVIICAYIY